MYSCVWVWTDAWTYVGRSVDPLHMDAQSQTDLCAYGDPPPKAGLFWGLSMITKPQIYDSTVTKTTSRVL